MEFDVISKMGVFEFRKKGECIINNPVIKVFHPSTQYHADFDAERTCRTIEKMEEMFELLGDYGYAENPISREEFNEKWDCRARGQKLFDYIKHGDKEEMVILRMSRKSAEEANFLKFEVDDSG